VLLFCALGVGARATGGQPLSRDQLGPSGGVRQRVIVNVGGRVFTSTRATLCRYEDSALVKLVNGEPEEDGSYFLDRNGENFGHILDFLRDGPEKWLAPTEPSVLRDVCHEAEHLELMLLARLAHQVADLHNSGSRRPRCRHSPAPKPPAG